jgi:hypothetical protein
MLTRNAPWLLHENYYRTKGKSGRRMKAHRSRWFISHGFSNTMSSIQILLRWRQSSSQPITTAQQKASSSVFSYQSTANFEASAPQIDYEIVHELTDENQSKLTTWGYQNISHWSTHSDRFIVKPTHQIPLLGEVLRLGIGIVRHLGISSSPPFAESLHAVVRHVSAQVRHGALGLNKKDLDAGTHRWSREDNRVEGEEAHGVDCGWVGAMIQVIRSTCTQLVVAARIASLRLPGITCWRWPTSTHHVPPLAGEPRQVTSLHSFAHQPSSRSARCRHLLSQSNKVKEKARARVHSFPLPSGPRG